MSHVVWHLKVCLLTLNAIYFSGTMSNSVLNNIYYRLAKALKWDTEF